MQSPPFHRYLVPPTSKYSPQHHILKSPSASFPPSMSATKFHTHTKQQTKLQFYISSSLNFWIANWKTKDSAPNDSKLNAIIIAFPQQQWLHGRISLLRHTYTAYRVWSHIVSPPLRQAQNQQHKLVQGIRIVSLIGRSSPALDIFQQRRTLQHETYRSKGALHNILHVTIRHYANRINCLTVSLYWRSRDCLDEACCYSGHCSDKIQMRCLDRECADRGENRGTSSLKVC